MSRNTFHQFDLAKPYDIKVDVVLNAAGLLVSLDFSQFGPKSSLDHLLLHRSVLLAADTIARAEGRGIPIEDVMRQFKGKPALAAEYEIIRGVQQVQADHFEALLQKILNSGRAA